MLKLFNFDAFEPDLTCIRQVVYKIEFNGYWIGEDYWSKPAHMYLAYLFNAHRAAIYLDFLFYTTPGVYSVEGDLTEKYHILIPIGGSGEDIVKFREMNKNYEEPNFAKHSGISDIVHNHFPIDDWYFGIIKNFHGSRIVTDIEDEHVLYSIYANSSSDKQLMFDMYFPQFAYLSKIISGVTGNVPLDDVEFNMEGLSGAVTTLKDAKPVLITDCHADMKGSSYAYFNFEYDKDYEDLPKTIAFWRPNTPNNRELILANAAYINDNRIFHMLQIYQGIPLIAMHYINFNTLGNYILLDPTERLEQIPYLTER